MSADFHPCTHYKSSRDLKISKWKSRNINIMGLAYHNRRRQKSASSVFPAPNGALVWDRNKNNFSNSLVCDIGLLRPRSEVRLPNANRICDSCRLKVNNFKKKNFSCFLPQFPDYTPMKSFHAALNGAIPSVIALYARSQ